MKSTRFDLSKHMPQHIAMKAIAVVLATVGLVGLGGSLTHADLVIQSSLENVIQTIQEIHITLDGTTNTPDRARLDKDGIYIEPSLLGGTPSGVLKLNADGYIVRGLIDGNNIENGSITSSHILSGSIQTGHLGFPYPATTNPNINLGCPAGEVMSAINNGMPTCVATTTTLGNCGAGMIAQGWTSTGLMVCNSATSGNSAGGNGGLWHTLANSSDIFYGTRADDNNGNVGIGLNAPLAKLHVNGSLRTDTTNGSFIVSGGRVGINTNSPLANLDVSGYVRLGSYAGNGTRLLGVDNAGFLVATSGAMWQANGTYLFTLAGNVGIGTNAPTQKLEVIGNVRATSYLTSSDRSLKKDISPLSHSLSKILALNPVSFRWKDTDKKDIGFIAQDVEPLFPDLVTTDNNGIKSVQYSNITAPIVASIQELYATINTTTERYESNQKRIESLEKKMKEIEKKLNIK